MNIFTPETQSPNKEGALVKIITTDSEGNVLEGYGLKWSRSADSMDLTGFKRTGEKIEGYSPFAGGELMQHIDDKSFKPSVTLQLIKERSA